MCCPSAQLQGEAAGDRAGQDAVAGMHRDPRVAPQGDLATEPDVALQPQRPRLAGLPPIVSVMPFPAIVKAFVSVPDRLR